MSDQALQQPQDERDHLKRGLFFQHLFGEITGLLCIGVKAANGEFREHFYTYPEQLEEAMRQVQRWAVSGNVYFCANLLASPRRLKQHVIECAHVWADLDTANPAHMLVPPTVILETSPGRSQAFWKFHTPQDVVETELLAKRIAYHHRDEGADISGWDMVQLLRVPLTSNFKYDYPHPRVKIVKATETTYSSRDFREYPAAPNEPEFTDHIEVPDKTAVELMQQYRGVLPDVVWHLFAGIPDEDWSKALWQLETNLAESGLRPEEAFVIARESGCNKYQRDKRGDSALWKEVQKAHAWYEAQKDVLDLRHQELSDLRADDDSAFEHDGFVERYIDWATNQTDAAPVYHEASAFLILSTLLSKSVRIPTRFNPEGMVPNLWFMILGDTTLTRKSTAMNMGVDMLLKIVPEAFTATDATIEGLLVSLAAAGGDPAVFVRDEFGGMLASIQKKDYYAGMMEMLTQLYDGRTIKRRLAKSQIEVIDPTFIMFTGGIRDRILELMTQDVISSGFAPRFLFFSADTDLERIQDLGPPVDSSWHGREELLDSLRKLKDKYDSTSTFMFQSEEHQMRRKYKAELTKEAWERHATLTRKLRKDGVESNAAAQFTPIFERLSISILKAAVLLAAERDENPVDDKVVVTLDDMTHAIHYGQGWRDTAVQVIANAGATLFEKRIREIFKRVKAEPGLLRSQLMHTFALNSRDADLVFDTLVQRGMIREAKLGKKIRYWPTTEDTK